MKPLNSFIKQHKSHWIYHCVSVFVFFFILYTLFFSPVIFSKRLLAPGDGFVYYLPAFYSSRTLWTNLLLSGFPVAADPQTHTWYPLSLLFSMIPNSWNAFVVSAYVLASSFSYGYVYTITQSRLAALVAGIIYGMSGFMMAHLGHTSIIHTALWMPLLIWSLENLRHRLNLNWLTIGVFAVSSSCLAGHPQIFVYTIGLSAIYAIVLGWSAPVKRWKYYKYYLAIVVLGVALSALQLIPTMELSKLGLRSEMGFRDFITFSLPPQQAILLLFPYLFGTHIASSDALYRIPYLGEWNLTELTGYIGLLPLMLATIGFFSYGSKSIRCFWLGVALFTFFLTWGEATPLAQLFYHLPAYNKFRVPARHFVEMGLAISVLAGLGIVGLKKQLVSNRLLLKTIVVSIATMIVSLIGIFLLSGQLQKKAIDVGIKQLSLLPWLNPSVGVPLVIFGIATATLLYWSKSTSSTFRGILLLLILVLDLGSFGWFYEWQLGIPQDLLKPSTSIQHYKKITNASQQRILPIHGGSGSIETIPPNISRMWQVPSVSGYGPLILSRYSQLLSMTPDGSVSESLLNGVDQALNITSTRYVFLARSVAESIIPSDNNNSSSFGANLNISLGSGCGVQRLNSIEIPAPEQVNVTAIGIVSFLGCSASIANNDEVLRILVTDTNGTVSTQSLQAGRDTSEWAYSCSDVLPLVQHQQAPIFERFPVERESMPPCEGYKYQSILPVNKLSNVKSLKLEWVGSSGAINIQKVTLIDDESKKSYPIEEVSSLRTDKKRWSHVEDINLTSVYENLRAMPRTWLVPEVISAEPDQILNSIKSSQLPDGHPYDPFKVAFVEESLDFKPQNIDASATAKIVNVSDTKVEVQTNSLSPSFLVLSDIYYPGWKATIDGKNTHIFQTNYILRGVLVMPGEHIVKFEFKPISFNIGLGISLAAMSLIGFLLLKLVLKPKNLII